MAVKKVSPLELAAHAAIGFIPIGTPERIALARALNGLKTPKPATRVSSSKLQKYSQCYATHDEHCYCSNCAPAKIAAGKIEHARLVAAGLVQTWSAKAVRELPAMPHVDTLRTQLSYCACGHRTDSHKEDGMLNLLKCEEPSCNCNHFHYAAEQEKKAA